VPPSRPSVQAPAQLEAKAAVPTVSPAPPSEAPAAAPSTPARVNETDAIHTTLSRYRTAFNVLDATAASAVWPTVDQKALGRAFDNLEQQSLTFDSCSIDMRGARALATCSGTAQYVPKVGNKNSRSDRRQWVFNLRKVDEQWLINEVNSR
jgi:hypothetical protein